MRYIPEAMRKKLASFRLATVVMEKLDDLVEARKKRDDILGFGFSHGHSYTRTRILELLIEAAHAQLIAETAKALELGDVPPATRKKGERKAKRK